VDHEMKIRDYNMEGFETLQPTDERDFEPILGRLFEEFCGGLHWMELEAAIQHALRGVKNDVNKLKLHSHARQDNTCWIVHAKVHPWYDATANIVGAVIEAHDIQDWCFKVEAQEALLSSRNLSAAWVLDTERTIHDLNAHCKLKALTQPFAEDTDMLKVLEDSEREALGEGIARALTGHNTACAFDMSQDLPRHDGREIVEITPMHDVANYDKIVGVLVARHPLCAVSVGNMGEIDEMTSACAKLFGVETQGSFGAEFMHLVAESSQPELLDLMIQTLERKQRGDALSTADFVTIASGKQLGLTRCTVEMTYRPDVKTDNDSVLVLVQAMESRPFETLRRRWGKEEDDELGYASAGWKSHKAIRFFDKEKYGSLNYVKTELRHQAEEGAGSPLNQSWEEACDEAFLMICAGEPGKEGFGMKELRRWLLLSNPEDRPQGISAEQAERCLWQTNYLAALMDTMNASSDNRVDGPVSTSGFKYVEKEAFIQWWKDACVTVKIAQQGQGSAVAANAIAAAAPGLAGSMPRVVSQPLRESL